MAGESGRNRKNNKNTGEKNTLGEDIKTHVKEFVEGLQRKDSVRGDGETPEHVHEQTKNGARPANDTNRLREARTARNLNEGVALKKQKPPTLVHFTTYLDDAKWLNDRMKSGPAQPANADLNHVQEIDKPMEGYKYLLKWPQRPDKSSVPISELKSLIHDVRAYSDENISQGQAEWNALRPDYWLPMLEGICIAAQMVAKNERNRMKRLAQLRPSAPFPT